MQIIHVIFLVHGCYLATNGLVWKRNSARQWEAVVDKKYQGSDLKSRSLDLIPSETGNVQYQQEEQLPNGTVVGKYGVLEPNGKLHLVHYTADKDGQRPKQDSVAQVEYVAEDTLKNVSPQDLKFHNQLADFNSIKAAIAPSGDSKPFLGPDDNPPFDRDPTRPTVPDVQGYASNYRPYSSVYHSKYYPDYYPGNIYYTGGGSGYSGGSNFYPDSRGYGMSYPTGPAAYPGYTYNSYGLTLPTKYHHTSQLYPKVEAPAIPNYYPLYDVPTPTIPMVKNYPCCSGK